MILRNRILIDKMRKFRFKQLVLLASTFFRRRKGLPNTVYHFAMDFASLWGELTKRRLDEFLFKLRVGQTREVLYFSGFSDDTLIYFYR